MGSLFNEPCCGDNQTAPKRKSKCGCICEELAKLAGMRGFNLCYANSGRCEVNILLKGQNSFLNLAGAGNPTDFTVVKVDRDRCCALLSYRRIGQSERTILIDCKCICAIQPADPGPFGETPA